MQAMRTRRKDSGNDVAKVDEEEIGGNEGRRTECGKGGGGEEGRRAASRLGRPRRGRGE